MTESKKSRSILNNIEKTNNFSVPEGYFENFASRLQEQLPVEKEPIKIISRFRYRLAIAASFIGIAVISFTGLKFIFNGSNNPQVYDTEMAEVISYQINEYDDNTLYDLYSATVNEASADESETADKDLDAMIDYLLNTDVDLQLIANEL